MRALQARVAEAESAQTAAHASASKPAVPLPRHATTPHAATTFPQAAAVQDAIQPAALGEPKPATAEHYPSPAEHVAKAYAVGAEYQKEAPPQDAELEFQTQPASKQE